MSYPDPHWPAGHEKAATTPAEFAIVYGVEISSRYQKHDEMVTLTKLISALPYDVRCWIREAWCDSKHGHAWHFEMAPDHDNVPKARCVGKFMHDQIMALHGGHNDLTVGEHVHLGADWGECASRQSRETGRPTG
jgi:hypothetical protein